MKEIHLAGLYRPSSNLCTVNGTLCVDSTHYQTLVMGTQDPYSYTTFGNGYGILFINIEGLKSAILVDEILEDGNIPCYHLGDAAPLEGKLPRTPTHIGEPVDLKDHWLKGVVVKALTKVINNGGFALLPRNGDEIREELKRVESL